ncbi:hypothetical protein BDQ12DRAFT_672121 [Crucibulum laeve]|uniref:Uncharacterized protein n=1 Tax=Crucibulum laeve TaxID=68775 RepID=A0A5C3LDH8_9AGAR|nr:hypothetical protein BDQ12DRAFT_672121 [Crucibulum laeve]
MNERCLVAMWVGEGGFTVWDVVGDTKVGERGVLVGFEEILDDKEERGDKGKRRSKVGRDGEDDGDAEAEVGQSGGEVRRVVVSSFVKVVMVDFGLTVLKTTCKLDNLATFDDGHLPKPSTISVVHAMENSHGAVNNRRNAMLKLLGGFGMGYGGDLLIAHEEGWLSKVRMEETYTEVGNKGVELGEQDPRGASDVWRCCEECLVALWWVS